MSAGLPAALLILLLTACSDVADPRPIATEFWRAQQAGDRARLRELVREEDLPSLDHGPAVLAISAFELGEPRLRDERAEFDTRITIAGEDALHLSLVTILVRSGDSWRVDYASTVRNITTDSPLAKVISRIQDLTTRLGAGVNQSLEELKRALPKLESELSTIEKDIRNQVPELRRRLDELMRDLPSAKPAPPPATGDRRAI